MKQTFLRDICALVALLCIATVCSVSAAAQTLYADGDFRYTVEEDCIILQHYYGVEQEITVPASIAGKPVSEIAAGTFADNRNVKTVNLPDTIMKIDEGAFAAGQKVNYNTNIALPQAPDPAEATEPTDITEITGTTGSTDTADSVQNNFAVGEAEVVLTPAPAPEGLAVNEQGNLVKKNDDGSTTVLDDTQVYTMTQNNDGTVEIIDASGTPVTKMPSDTAATPKVTMLIVCVAAGVLILAGAAFFLYSRRKH